MKIGIVLLDKDGKQTFLSGEEAIDFLKNNEKELLATYGKSQVDKLKKIKKELGL